MKRHKHKRTPFPLVQEATSSKGEANRKIIRSRKEKGRDYFLHATKGYRSYVSTTE